MFEWNVESDNRIPKNSPFQDSFPKVNKHPKVSTSKLFFMTNILLVRKFTLEFSFLQQSVMKLDLFWQLVSQFLRALVVYNNHFPLEFHSMHRNSLTHNNSLFSNSCLLTDDSSGMEIAHIFSAATAHTGPTSCASLLLPFIHFLDSSKSYLSAFFAFNLCLLLYDKQVSCFQYR